MNVYEYSHDDISNVTVAFLFAEKQPLAGGYSDTAEGRAQSAKIMPLVHTAPDLDSAKMWAFGRAPCAIRQFTDAKFDLRFVRHSQAVECLVCEA